MFYVKSPLRITLGGGGTDLPWWYRKNGGYVLTAAINKYVYVIGNKRKLDNKIQLSYSRNEICDDVSQVKNEIFKECFKAFKIRNSLEIHTMSDVPGNSGLGSSGSFISAINYFLKIYKNKKLTKQDIANLSCKIEMLNLKRNCGKQDQFISTFGGIRELIIDTSGKVKIKKINIKHYILKKIQNSLAIFYTGYTRPSELILTSQKKFFENSKTEKNKIMKEIEKIGHRTKKYLVNGDIENLGVLCRKHWNLKKKLTPLMSSPVIDSIYREGIENGAEGGKILGAGGGGYIMFYVKEKNKKRFIKSIKKFNLPELEWAFDHQGVRQIKD